MEYSAGGPVGPTYDFPGPLYVGPGGGMVSDRQPEDDAPVQRSVGQEYLAGCIDLIEQLAVGLVAPFAAEAD